MVSAAVNWGPLSGRTDCGIVWARNSLRSLAMMAGAVVLVPRPYRSGQLEYSSVTTSYWFAPYWHRSRCKIWNGLVAIGPWRSGCWANDGRVSRHSLQVATIWATSWLIVGHHTVRRALSWVFLMPWWAAWSCSRALRLEAAWMMILGPYSKMP